ncbi:hypothetical protein FSB73_13035 [Arachidicoccus ginsenosidivorans]|uniref:Uncharacterized protein n=1 Tax=Arachidicoccus ginsenosidivorans TaxID=496057 RepID=A0A5B8VN07_9BACT|nr:hypothetical protein [Arachidicoccus ginsenosidivorans]QEC72461.1 hypothetical protein FSB73_13035 [Arachidicoccus ginsenosidivorans]
MRESRYGIHDISLVKSQKENEYARMNMPFELGIDYGLRKFGGEKYKGKKFLILGGKKYDHLPAISDINGMDIMCHDNETLTLIQTLRKWFSSVLNIKDQPPPSKLSSEYFEFQTALFEKMTQKHGNEILDKEVVANLTNTEFISEINQACQ